MKTLAIAIIFVTAVSSWNPSAGWTERLLVDLLTVFPVLWGMFRWAKSEKKRREEERQKIEAERARREKLYSLMDPADGSPSILSRMEKAEEDNARILQNQDEQWVDNDERFNKIDGRLDAIETKLDAPNGKVRT